LKLKKSLKYILNAISYGVIAGLLALVFLPQLRDSNNSLLDLLKITEHKPEPISYSRAVAAASPAVVNIISEAIQRTPGYNRVRRQAIDLGSGVIMDAKGYILTALHVVQNADLISVQLQSGQVYPADLIGYDTITDLAVLKVNATNLPAIPQSSDMVSKVGDVVLAIGNPYNLGQTVTQGIIGATGRVGLSNESYLNYLQMDAAINKGNSGGALVNTNGELVGINSAVFTPINRGDDAQGIFFSVPYQLANKVMQEIIKNGRVIRGWLGIQADEVINANGTRGILISNIVPSSPAAEAGFEVNDIIIEFNNTSIGSINEVLKEVSETPPYTKLTFKVIRKSETLDLEVTVLEKK